MGYGFTFTSLPPQIFSQICERWLKSYLMQVYKPCHYNLVEAVEPFKLHPMSMAYPNEDLSTFSRCRWDYGFTLTPLTEQILPKSWGSWLKSYLMQVCKPCHNTLIEAEEPFKLHPMSMAYLYARFEYLLRWWMGIRLHIHIVSPQTLPQICESWLNSYLMQVCKPCH
jgi:hypothetical protein